MQKFLTLYLILTSFITYAQQGTIKESLKLKSTVLGREVEYSIYLPADYDKSNRRYPVLYLLHGLGDDETGWIQAGEVQSIADKTINNGDAPAMIIVMPDAGKTWYMNSADGKNNYEDFFIRELIPHIETSYRIRATKGFRGIAGLSMGGFGTLLLATKHPDLFAAAAPLSGAVFTDTDAVTMADSEWARRFTVNFPQTLKGKDRLTDHWYKNSIPKIIETTPVELLKSIRYYIDCGDDDHLIKQNMALHALLIDKGIPHEFRVRDGAHTWIYWRTALPEVLKFVGASFR
ncbi:alpha/beta hydrolase family protein [Cytophagaceae bacterium YF14B1]|uniref:Alpha/beta hydrolase family protein n=1 Tax=Xanthocytophaga flava TaxID=3048013 RepID=A0AAE3QLR3_9BACT|nr:alpha/beta hydrolase family protein [Xanthocytophaga flavus]MDJ1481647.1 alpha/beta hydrolase family protein [Xanthocytophaga flavus]